MQAGGYSAGYSAGPLKSFAEHCGHDRNEPARLADVRIARIACHKIRSEPGKRTAPGRRPITGLTVVHVQQGQRFAEPNCQDPPVLAK